MIGITFFLCWGITIYLGIKGWKGIAQDCLAPNQPMTQTLTCVFLAAALSLLVFAGSMALFYGQFIYMFDLALYIFLINIAVLSLPASIMRHATRKLRCVLHLMRFGLVFTICYWFTVFEPLRRWLNIKAHY